MPIHEDDTIDREALLGAMLAGGGGAEPAPVPTPPTRRLFSGGAGMDDDPDREALVAAMTWRDR